MDISNVKIDKTATIIKTTKITNDTTVKVANSNPKQTNVDMYIGDAQMLDEANVKLNKMYEVDIDKVKQVKQAISDGEIDIDLASLSKAISDEHLLGNGNDE